MKDKSRAKIVIVGGGISGLYIALKLQEYGFKNITILEATERLGGRILTVETEDGVIELGAQWVHGKGENPLWKFVSNNNFEIGQLSAGDGSGEFYLPGGHVLPQSDVREVLDKLQAVHCEMNKFTRKAYQEPLPFSVGQYFQDRFKEFFPEEEETNDSKRKLRRSLFDWLMRWERVDTGVDDLYQQSVWSWSDYIDFDREGASYDTVLVKGNHAMVDFMEGRLKASGVEIHTNTKVKEIIWKDDSASAICESETNERIYEADHIIVTVSLGVLKSKAKEMFTPELPKEKLAIIDKLGFGTMDRILIKFPEPFWSQDVEDGLQMVWPDGDEWKEICDQNDLPHWTRDIPGFDSVPASTWLCGWICGEAASEAEKMSDEEVLEASWKLIKLFTGRKDLPKPNICFYSRWFNNQNYQGSYSYATPACDALGIGPWTLAEPVGSDQHPVLLFGGEATSTNGYGTMHGAFESGEREAHRLNAIYAEK